MINNTPCTIKLQDGSYCNLKKRLFKNVKPLLTFFSEIPDHRKDQGKRHSLALILLLVFVATLQGSKGIKDISLFGKFNQKLFERLLGIKLNSRPHHGIPSATTISRVLEELDPDLLVNAFLQFLEILGMTSILLGDVLSFDGKTIRGANGEDIIRHILSLFSHESHLAVGQVGIESKSSEIAALERLLEQASGNNLIAGKLLLGDALFTQKRVVDLILGMKADYLFVVKGNQPRLRGNILNLVASATRDINTDINTITEIEAKTGAGTRINQDISEQITTNRKRKTTTKVTALKFADLSEEHQALFTSWQNIQTIGVLHRTGTRIGKDKKITQVNETVGFISSRSLTAEEVATHLHNHWCIENNLHWVKDEIFGEDKHTLRKGKAPQIMSFIRSMCITICNFLKVKSISDVIHNLQKSSLLLEQFLRMGAIV